MNKYFVVICLVFFVCCSLFAETNSFESTNVISETELLDYFDTIAFSGTNLVLTFKDSGRRFKYVIDDEKAKINNYGESILLPAGSSLKIIERGSTLTFTDLPDAIRGCGFQIKMKVDHRSMGGKLRHKDAYLAFEPEGEDKKDLKKSKRLKRVKVLSPSVEQVKALLHKNKGVRVPR